MPTKITPRKPIMIPAATRFFLAISPPKAATTPPKMEPTMPSLSASAKGASKADVAINEITCTSGLNLLGLTDGELAYTARIPLHVCRLRRLADELHKFLVSCW